MLFRSGSKSRMKLRSRVWGVGDGGGHKVMLSVEGIHRLSEAADGFGLAVASQGRSRILETSHRIDRLRGRVRLISAAFGLQCAGTHVAFCKSCEMLPSQNS